MQTIKELKQLNAQRRAILRMVYVTYKNSIDKGTYIGLCEVFRRCLLEYIGGYSEDYQAVLDYYFPNLRAFMKHLAKGRGRDFSTGHLWPLKDTEVRFIIIDEMIDMYRIEDEAREA